MRDCTLPMERRGAPTTALPGHISDLARRESTHGHRTELHRPSPLSKKGEVVIRHGIDA